MIKKHIQLLQGSNRLAMTVYITPVLALLWGRLVLGETLGQGLWLGAACIVGAAFVALPPALEWIELVFGVGTILAVYGFVIWRWGFGPDDRALFRRQKAA